MSRIFNQLVLFTCHSYLEKSQNDGLNLSPIHHQLKASISAYMMLHRFSKAEAKIITDLGEDERLKKITATEVSYLVYVLELVKLFVETVPKSERPHLNISDKRLKHGKAHYFAFMLEMKRRDPEQYKKTKDLVNDSVLSAKHFFGFMEEHLKAVA